MPGDLPPLAPCDGEKCSFAVTKVVAASDPETGLTDSNFAAFELVLSAETEKTSYFLEEARVKSRPVRRHLEIGVLLI